MDIEQEYNAELLESAEDDVQNDGHSAGTDEVGNEMMGKLLRQQQHHQQQQRQQRQQQSPIQQQQPQHAQQHQQLGLFSNNNVRLMEYPSLDAMFGAQPTPRYSVDGLLTNGFIKQFASPFGFATSSLR